MSSSAFMVAEAPPRYFTRREYHTMADAGILTPEDHVELIRGEIFVMMPLGPWHISATEVLQAALRKTYGDIFHVRSPGVLGLSDHSEPQPDSLVLRRRDDYYRTSHPRPVDALLVIEVADSSRAYDLGTKHDLYAEHGIREYWVVDGQRRCVHVFRNPHDSAFQEMKVYQPGQSIPLPECDGAELPVAEMGL